MSSPYRKLKLLMVVVTVFWLPHNAYAVNKALLIGTTEYESEQNNLPGIELDLLEMNRVARKLGFAEENIRSLTGADVNLASIESQFVDFLGEGVAPNDTILIYYSGHGVQVPDLNGDEVDNVDEAISLYNLSGVYNPDNEDEIIWDGVLLDDRLAELLSRLVSENVLVIVDACHSGTVTRSYTGNIRGATKAYGNNEFSVKSLGPPQQATRSFKNSDNSVVDEEASGVITLSAAQDHQQALSSSKGSLFTLALAESLDAQRGKATPKSLIESAGAILDRRLNDELVYQPNLTGDETLYAKPIVLTDAHDRGEINQSDLLELANEVSPLDIHASKAFYNENDLISFTVDVPTSGYINVVSVDSNDDMVVLFPNGIDRNNKVEPGLLSLPGERNFNWAAQAPWGSTMVAILFSKNPFSLFDLSLQRAQDGGPDADYLLPSLASFKSYTDDTGAKAAAVAFVKTCSENGQC